MAWSKNGTPHTLSGTSDTITISDLTASKFNQFVYHVLPSGTINNYLAFDNDTTASNYAIRYNYNGGTDTAGANTLQYFNVNNADELVVVYTCNISGEEKLSIAFSVDVKTAGATNAPGRAEFTSKWVTTSGQFSRADVKNTQSGDFATGSNLTALNGDTTEVAVLPKNLQSGSRFEATDTRKIYYGATPTATLEHDFPSSTGWSYEGTAGKMSISGNKLSFTTSASGIDARYFYNIGTSITGDFVLDYKMNLTTTSYNIIGQAINFRFGLSNGGTGYSGETPTSAHVTSSISGYHTGSYMYNYFLSHNGSTTTNTYDTDVWTIPTSTTQTYYARISRSGSTLELKFFEDANRTTQIGATKTLTSSATYNYLWAKVFSQSTTNTYEGYVEDVKLYNGVSSTDFTWTEEA